MKIVRASVLRPHDRFAAMNKIGVVVAGLMAFGWGCTAGDAELVNDGATGDDTQPVENSADHVVECLKTTRTTTFASSSSEFSRWTAEIPLQAVLQRTRLTATICGLVETEQACPDNATCTGSLPAKGDCAPAAISFDIDGSLFVDCGFEHVVYNEEGGVTSQVTARRTTAYVWD